MPSSALAANSLETLEVSVEVSLALKSIVSVSMRSAGIVSMVRNGTLMLTSDGRNGEAVSVPGLQDGLQAQAIAEAAVKSLETGSFCQVQAI